MKLCIFKNRKRDTVQRGFTLIETLVAITVLMLAVTGPLVISQKGLSAAGYAKDQMTAYYLAQDAMEYVRAVRDAAVLNSVSDWLSVSGSSGQLSVCNTSGATCTIDTRTSIGTVTQCTDPCAVRLTKNQTTFEYGYESLQLTTPFVRSVKIEKPSGGPLVPTDTEAKVTVTVTWPTLSGQTRNVTLVENLFKQN